MFISNVKANFDAYFRIANVTAQFEIDDITIRYLTDIWYASSSECLRKGMVA